MRLKIGNDKYDNLSFIRLVANSSDTPETAKSSKSVFDILVKTPNIRLEDIPEFPSWTKYANYKYDLGISEQPLCIRYAVISWSEEKQKYLCLELCEGHSALLYCSENELVFDEDSQ